MELETQIGSDISVAKDWLDKGELVAIPTETVYGLAGNGLREDSVLKIFHVKNRPHFDPLILHVASLEQLEPLVKSIPTTAITLTKMLWPGPLTIVLPKSTLVPDLVTSGTPNVAIRIPKHPITLELLRKLNYPLAAPSANPFKYVSPTSAQHVYQHLGGKIPYILNGGECLVGIESSIISFVGERPVLLRHGGLDLEYLQSLLPDLDVQIQSHPKQGVSVPGQLEVHYAPKCRLIPLSEHAGQPLQQKEGSLYFQKSKNRTYTEHEYFLSEQGEIKQAAQRLFHLLRLFDDKGYERIYFEWAPEIGLGRAINDRLRRASAQK